MEIGISIWMIVSGVFITLVGFKTIDLFKNEIEKKELWYRKWGNFFKYGGIIMSLLGVFVLVSSI